MSRPLPGGSALNGYLVENDNESQAKEKDVHSVTHEYHQGEDEDVDDLGQTTSLVKAWKPNQKEKKPVKHLWHAALVLLLERGRSVTRACYFLFIFLIYPKVKLTLPFSKVVWLSHPVLFIKRWMRWNDWVMNYAFMLECLISV